MMKFLQVKGLLNKSKQMNSEHRMMYRKNPTFLFLEFHFSIWPLKDQASIKNSEMENGIFLHDTFGGRSSMNCLQLLLLLTRRIMDNLNAPCLHLTSESPLVLLCVLALLISRNDRTIGT